MILIGFGCSITKGDGVDPKDNFLSLLGQAFDFEILNLAESGNSNYGIGQQFANFICNERHRYQDVAVVVAWTEVGRMSWWDEDTFHWVHGKHIEQGIERNKFQNSFKEWVLHSQGDEASGNQALTDSSKLLVNSVCNLNNISLLQLNSLGSHHTFHKYSNYYLPDQNTLDYLSKSDIGGLTDKSHPNEQGHKKIANRLINFTKQRKIFK